MTKRKSRSSSTRPRKQKRSFRDPIWNLRMDKFGELLRDCREVQGKVLADLQDPIWDERGLDENHYTPNWCGKVERGEVRNVTEAEVAMLFRWYGCNAWQQQHMLLVLNCHALGLKPADVTPPLIWLTLMVPSFLPRFMLFVDSMGKEQQEIAGLDDDTRKMVGLLAMKAVSDELLREFMEAKQPVPSAWIQV